MSGTLYVGGYTGVYQYGADLATADAIRYSEAQPGQDVSFTIYNIENRTWPAVLDLSAKLGSIGAHIDAIGSLAVVSGDGDDYLSGSPNNSFTPSNTIYGGGGSDTILGGHGGDILSGDAGNDIITSGYGDDTITGGDGNDTVTGGGGHDMLSGNDGDDALIEKTLIFGIGATIDGGAGMDVVYVNGQDVWLHTFIDVETLVVEGGALQAKIAQLQSLPSITASLDDPTGALDLQFADGGAADFSNMFAGRAVTFRAGSTGVDLTVGDTGYIVYDGSGKDTLTGGAGNDRISAGDGDIVDAGDGNDEISVGGRGSNVTAGAGDDTVSLSPAESFVNTIDGGAGTNTLEIPLSWQTAAFIDKVSFTNFQILQANIHVDGTCAQFESFNTIASIVPAAISVALGLADSGDVNLADELGAQSAYVYAFAGGNAITTGSGDDTLYGDIGNDKLNGGGGSDTMSGKAGNDTYIVDAFGDVVTEAANEGKDTVRTGLSYTLGVQVEKLVLTGTDEVDANGNRAANVLMGNSGANVLDGKTGADTLKGGGGADTFVFGAALKNANVDTIVDFGHVNDDFELDNSAFVGLSGITLATGAFKIIASGSSTKGVDGTDRVLYDKAHGDLYFDRDGSGSTYHRLLFAHVKDGIVLDSSDFHVV